MDKHDMTNKKKYIYIDIIQHVSVNKRQKKETTFFIESPLTPQAQQQASILPSLLAFTTTATAGQIGDVRVNSQRLRNLLPRIDPTNINQPTARLGHSLADDIGTLGLTLRPDHVGLSFLLRTLDNEPSPLRILLRNLLLLDGPSKLLAKRHVGDRHILQGNVELGRAFQQVAADAVRDGLSLCDEFGGVKLGHDGLEDLISDGWEDSFIVIRSV